MDRPLTPHLAKLVGAKEEEIAHTSTLTSNMHNLFISFYKPTKKRWKIVIEMGSFPSDWVSDARNQARMIGSRRVQSPSADFVNVVCCAFSSEAT